MHGERGRGGNGKDESRTRRDFYARRFPNSRSYGIGSHKLKSTRALAREGTRRALFHSDSYSFCASAPGAAATHTREAVQLQLHPTYFRVSHLAVFASHGSSLSARSPFFSNLSLPVFLVFVRLNDAIPRDQMRMRFHYASLGGRIVDCEMRSTSYRWRDFVIRRRIRRLGPIAREINTIYEIIFLQRIMSRCGISRIGKGKEADSFSQRYAEISRWRCNLRRLSRCDLMKSVS